MATSKLSVKRNGIDYYVEADCDVCPGEPMVRYYADGSGYPGSDPTIECVDCRVIECEYDYTDSTKGTDRTGYKSRADMGDWAEFADRAICTLLQDGTHCDDLFDGLEDVDYGDYPERDDYDE